MTTTPRREPFPFSAVVGQEDAKLALLLAAVDPHIGGVLLRGEKGSAKSTLARGLAELLPEDAPFVELPVGATEDRVFGSLDVHKLVGDPGLSQRDARGPGGSTGPAAAPGGWSPAQAFKPGLLDAAHEGVLYVDEVNLLPDHLVDGLLDAAASGVNHVERDGVSHAHPAQFVLVGSMNPEEGELRPQLLDRFGLVVDVRSSTDPAQRAEAVRRRLAHDAGRTDLSDQADRADLELRRRMVLARPAALPNEVIDFAAALAVAVESESLRADLVLCRAAAALAGWSGRPSTTEDDVRQVAPLALGHRRRRRPFDPPTLPADELETALANARAMTGQPDAQAGEQPGETTSSSGSGPDAPERGTASRRNGTSSTEAASPVEEAAPESSPEPESRPEPASSPPVARDRSNGRGDGSARSRAPAPDGRWQDLAGDTLRAGEADPDLAAAVPRHPSNPQPRGGAQPLPGAQAGRGQRSRSSAPSRAPSNGGSHNSGPVVGSAEPGPGGPRGVAVVPSLRAMTQRRAAHPDSHQGLAADDLREPKRTPHARRTIVLAVDASGSMGTTARVQAATGAVMSLLADAYLARDQVAMVAFRGDGAHEVLPPTASVELARARLADLPTGGSTPLAEGITMALATAKRAVAKQSQPVLVMLTDGRATGASGALDAARAAARAVADSGIQAVVLDAEDPTSPTRLGLASELAELMQAPCVRLSSISRESVESAVRNALPE